MDKQPKYTKHHENNRMDNYLQGKYEEKKNERNAMKYIGRGDYLRQKNVVLEDKYTLAKVTSMNALNIDTLVAVSNKY